MEISEIFKSLRNKHKLTQKEVADKLGILQSRYSNYENGYSKPSIEMIEKFYEVLDEDFNNFQIRTKEHFDCKVMDSDFKDVRSVINSINDKRLRRKMIFEFGELMEDFKKRIKDEVMDEE